MRFNKDLHSLLNADMKNNNCFRCNIIEFNNNEEALDFAKEFSICDDGYMRNKYNDVYARISIRPGIRWSFEHEVYVPTNKTEVKYWLQKGYAA